MSIDLKDAALDTEIPEGDHVIRAVNSEVEEKNGGTYVVVKFAVEGQGRHIYERFTMAHSNPKAVQIGRGRLKTFLTVAGYATPDLLKDVWDCNGLTCKAKVKTKHDDTYGDKSVIAAFKPLVSEPKAGAIAKKPDDKLPAGW